MASKSNLKYINFRFSDNSVPPRKIVREDSNSSSSSDVKVQNPRENTNRAQSTETEPKPRIETVTSTVLANEAIDLTTKKVEEKTIRTANFYHETLIEPIQTVQPKLDPVFQQHRSVIQINPKYATPQPSTSTYTTLTPIEPVQRIEIVPKQDKPLFFIDISQNNNMLQPVKTPSTPVLKTPLTPVIKTPVTPILNIDFTKNLANPEIKVLNTSAANIVGVKNEGKSVQKTLQRQNSKQDMKRDKVQPPIDIDHINSGDLQIDEDYDT